MDDLYSPHVTLRPYQKECIESIITEARNGVLRQVIVLSTGAGKTVVFGHLPKRVKQRGKKTLVLAHREELLDQARDKMLVIDPSLKIEVEQGDRESDDIKGADVIIASVQTLGRKGSKRIEKFDPKDFGLIVIDECFPYDTKVDCGEEVHKIGDIVEKRMNVDLKSVLNPINTFPNYTKKRKITRYIKVRNSKPLLNIKFSKYKSLQCTENHKFPVLDIEACEVVLKQACELKRGDIVFCIGDNHSRSPVPSSDKFQFFLALLLADSPHLRFTSSNSTDSNVLELFINSFENLKIKAFFNRICKGNYKVKGVSAKLLRSLSFMPKSFILGKLNVRGLLFYLIFCSKLESNSDRPISFDINEDIRDLVSYRVENELGLNFLETFLKYRILDDSNSRRFLAMLNFLSSKYSRFGDYLFSFLYPRHNKKELKAVEGIKSILSKNTPNGKQNSLECLFVNSVTVSDSNPEWVYNLEVEGEHFYNANGVIVSNCHHATASTYRNILDYFGALKENSTRKDLVLLGVTATPNRADHSGLDQIFDKITYNYPLRRAIEEGYLSNIKAYMIQTGTDLSNVHTQMGDFVEKELSEAIDTGHRNGLIVQSYKEICDGKKAIVFASNVEHAFNLRLAFSNSGVPAETVLGTTDREERKDIFERFKSGAIKVLVNISVLTEGFDEPSIEAVLMARPTKSSVLYAQQVGRGTRLFEGKENMILIDFVDNMGKNSIMSLTSLFGVGEKPLKGLNGKLITQTLAKIDKMKEVNPDVNLEIIEDWSDENIEKVVKEIDIFAQAELHQAVKEKSKFAWSVYEDGFRLKFPLDEKGVGDLLEIKPNFLEQYEIKRTSFSSQVPSFANGFSKYKKDKEELIGVAGSLDEAFKKGDGWIIDNKPEQKIMFDQKSKWRKEPPSQAQIGLLKKLGVAIPNGLSKGQASTLISKHLDGGKKKSKKF